MPFEIVKNDITAMTADAIVYNGNPQPFIRLNFAPVLSRNTDKDLKKQRAKLGPISIGTAKIAPSTKPEAKYVIHTAGPSWHGGMYNEINLLRSCYENIFQLAVEYQCKSIALPIISSENLGFPKKLAQEIGFTCITDFLKDHEMMIYIVVPGKTAIVLPSKTYSEVSNYIKKNYVEETASLENPDEPSIHKSKSDLIIEYCRSHDICDIVEINQILFKFDQPSIH